MRQTKEPNAIDIYVGSKIRARRLVLKKSQGSLADALGITFQQVQKYENGANRVGASRLQHISLILGVPISYFFAAAENDTASNEASACPAEEEAVTSFLSTSEGIELNTAFRRLDDPKLRHNIVLLVKSLAGAAETEHDEGE